MSATDAVSRPWIGSAYRHIPAAGGRDVLDFQYARKQPDNRWNAPEDPTRYLAGDPGILIADWGRHFPLVFDDAMLPAATERSVCRLSLRLERAVDLRQRTSITDQLIENSPTWFANRDLARAVARSFRANHAIQALIVPSIAFLDDPTRWHLVVFLDTMPDTLPTHASSWITRTGYVGPLRWR